jgi:hypothetical protein
LARFTPRAGLSSGVIGVRRIASAETSEGTLVLERRGADEFVIAVQGRIVMSSRAHRSERDLVVELPRARFSGFFAWITWLAVHIVYLIGFRNRLLVLLEWAWAYLTFQRSARIISHPEAARGRGPSGS